MANYEPGQQLLFEDMIVSFHSENLGRSIIRLQGVKPEVMIRLKRRHDFYVDIGNSAYLRIDNDKLLPYAVKSNRQVAHLLTKEE